MDPVCCRAKDARRSVNTTGALPVQMLCPLTQTICLLIVGTAVLNMQTGKEGIKDLKDQSSHIGEESHIGVAAIILKTGRGCKTKADEQRGLGAQVLLLLVCSLQFCLTVCCFTNMLPVLHWLLALRAFSADFISDKYVCHMAGCVFCHLYKHPLLGICTHCMLWFWS